MWFGLLDVGPQQHHIFVSNPFGPFSPFPHACILVACLQTYSNPPEVKQGIQVTRKQATNLLYSREAARAIEMSLEANYSICCLTFVRCMVHLFFRSYAATHSA